MSDTALLYSQFADVGTAVVQAHVSEKEIGEAVSQANASAKQFVQRAQVTVEKAVTLSRILRDSWETFFARSESGLAERARALRGDFLQRLVHSLALIGFAREQADKAALLEGKPVSGADLLTENNTALESIQREALAKWGIGEDMLAQLGKMADMPLHLDKYGDIHVGRSRVSLDTIVGHFKAGMSPADIARGYNTVSPADIGEVIAYYLRHTDDVEAYLQRRNEEAAVLWQQIESTQSSKSELIAQLKERWAQRKTAHATPAE